MEKTAKSAMLTSQMLFLYAMAKAVPAAVDLFAQCMLGELIPPELDTSPAFCTSGLFASNGVGRSLCSFPSA